jgi:hypothetical protein
VAYSKLQSRDNSDRTILIIAATMGNKKKQSNGQQHGSHDQNQPNATKTAQCQNCGKSGHWTSNCRSKSQQSQRPQKPISTNVKPKDTHKAVEAPTVLANRVGPFQIPDAEPEEIWCRWCNSQRHNSLTCNNINQQAIIELMPDILANTCSRCAYKGHINTDCCNPIPDAKCWLCNRSGHSNQNCLRRGLPALRKVLDRVEIRGSRPATETGSPRHSRSRVESSRKKKNHTVSLDAYSQFVDSLVHASKPCIEEDKQPNPEGSLINIMTHVLSYQNGMSFITFGKDLSEVVAKMHYLHYSEGIYFWGIKHALKRIEAGFSVHCNFPDCHGQTGIFDHDLNPIQPGAIPRSLYDQSADLHVVFLACTCFHNDWPSLIWKRTRVIRQADSTAFELLKAAQSNPVIAQYINLKAGVAKDTEQQESDREFDNADDERAAEKEARMREQLRVELIHAYIEAHPEIQKMQQPKQTEKHVHFTNESQPEPAVALTETLRNNAKSPVLPTGSPMDWKPSPSNPAQGTGRGGRGGRGGHTRQSDNHRVDPDLTNEFDAPAMTKKAKKYHNNNTSEPQFDPQYDERNGNNQNHRSGSNYHNNNQNHRNHNNNHNNNSHHNNNSDHHNNSNHNNNGDSRNTNNKKAKKRKNSRNNWQDNGGENDGGRGEHIVRDNNGGHDEIM